MTVVLKRLLGTDREQDEVWDLTTQASKRGRWTEFMPRARGPSTQASEEQTAHENKSSHLQREERGGWQTAGTTYEEVTELSGTHGVADSLVHRSVFWERKSKGRGWRACGYAAHLVSPGELGTGPGAQHPEKHGASSRAPGPGRPALTFCQPGDWEDLPQVGLSVPLLRSRILLLRVLVEEEDLEDEELEKV